MGLTFFFKVKLYYLNNLYTNYNVGLSILNYILLFVWYDHNGRFLGTEHFGCDFGCIELDTNWLENDDYIEKSDNVKVFFLIQNEVLMNSCDGLRTEIALLVIRQWI